jgi:hypothetical protein
MKTLFSVFYYFILTNGDPDNVTASFRAATILAICQTSNIFSLVFLSVLTNLIDINGQWEIYYLGIVCAVFTLINLLFLKRKDAVTKRDKAFTLIYLIFSFIIFTILIRSSGVM